MALKKRTFFRAFVLALFVTFYTSNVYAQSEQQFETDPIILNRIDQWQDLKFGLMMHWGIYAQWGVVESWSICNEPWISRDGAPYTEYKAKYQALNKTFNPTRFDPESCKIGQGLWNEVFCVYNQAPRRVLYV